MPHTYQQPLAAGAAHPTHDHPHDAYPDDLYDVYAMPDLDHLVFPLPITDPALTDTTLGPVAA